MSTLYLAWAYLRFHLWRSLVLVLAIALILIVPLAIRTLLAAGERQLTARAEATPLLIGSRGSSLDLVMASLYFTDDRPMPTTEATVDAIWDSGLATAIPMHLRFEAQGAPIVGTSLDYFDLRGLEVAEGRGLALLGEAVLGAGVARDLGLRPGSSIVSSPDNLFDIAGAYPLKMSVVGVLAPTGGPDDGAVFVDIRTAWVIAGVGHGHAAPPADGDPGLVLGRTATEAGANIVAGAALPTYTEITPDNIDSFHFHGDPAAFPVTAVIAVPNDFRSGAILRGRYLDAASPLQVVVPGDVVAGLLDSVFRVARLVNAVMLVIAAAAATALALAVFLSVQLRQREIETIFKLGCRRLTIARLVAAEIGLMLLAALALAGLGYLALSGLADTAALRLLARPF